MHWPRILAIGFTLRRLLRDARVIREQLTRQADLLERLANRIAPADPRTHPDDVRATTGLDYLDPVEAAMVEDYIARTRAALGRDPEGDEILTYLADERTSDLHARLIAREADLERLGRDRAQREPGP